MSILEEIYKNRDLFIQFNELKYKRFQLLIGNPAVRRVVNSIPILLSVNHKRLPGYVDGNVPYGIVNFQPDIDAVKYLQGRFYVKEMGIRETDPLIEMMAVMGSVGTIAYTRDSDFDYWVCIDRKSVPADQMAKFQEKVDAVQSWAMKEMEIEAHIFINDIATIKNNIFAESKEEAFGSIIGAVLKDEFFRSSIIIAGKTPFWWTIPRFVRDDEYENLYAQVPAADRKKYFIDLGNLFEISKEDFVGAALFLIIKSLGNPFKSIIKLGLLEKYLFGPEHSPLLSQKVKSSILHGSMDNRIIDSYILMFEEVYHYYESSVTDKTLLKNLRQNLYLKINPQLSRYFGMKDRQNLPYKVLVMFKYVKEWGWSARDIQEMDGFESWDYNQTMVFWNMVKKFMILSYQKIATQIPAMKLEEKISESDFKLLSRKIKSHFAHEGNKIDHYITFKDTPYEAILNVEPASGNAIGGEEWCLIKRSAAADESPISTVLRTEKGLVRLLAWAAINQIYDPTFSRIKFQTGYSRVNQNVVIELIGKIADVFSGTMKKLRNEYYLRPAFNMVNMIIINFGMENAESIQTVHHIYQTSWGESYIDEYGPSANLVTILGTIVQGGITARRGFDEYCVIITPEPFKKHYRDIEQIFKEAYDFIVGTDRRRTPRFMARLGGKYLSITRDGETVVLESEADIVKIMTRTSLNPRVNISYSFYGSDVRLQILESLYKTRKRSYITAAFEESGDYLLLYVIDERDNVFLFIKPKSMKENAIVFLFDFCQNVVTRINSSDKNPDINQGMQLFQINLDRFGKFTLENKTQWAEKLYMVTYTQKKAIAARVAKNTGPETMYSLAANEGSNSSFVSLKDVPGQLKKLKQAVPAVCSIINDIAFTDLTGKDYHFGSTLYFFEKFRMELIIDKMLK